MHKINFKLLTADDSKTLTGNWDLEYSVTYNGMNFDYLPFYKEGHSLTTKPTAGASRPMFDSMQKTLRNWLIVVLGKCVAEMQLYSNREELLKHGSYIKIDAKVIKEDNGEKVSLPLVLEFMEMIDEETVNHKLFKHKVFSSINGKVFKTTEDFDSMLTTIALKTADLTYTNTDITVWRKDVKTAIEIPVDIKYAITNRTPYSFYYIDNDKQDITLKEVLLNVKRISANECAIELSDGVWGSFNFEAMQLFIEAYRYSRRNAYSNISPRQLFVLSMGRTPSEAENELMIHYLMQNRTSDIVADRASKMLDDIVSKHSSKVFVKYNDKKPNNVFSHIDYIKVRGIGCDWKIIPNSKSKAIDVGRQAVKTRIFRGNGYSDPICIDNSNNNSPLGDQIATRILATMNDEYMVSRIHTVSSLYREYEGRRDREIDSMLKSQFGEEE